MFIIYIIAAIVAVIICVIIVGLVVVIICCYAKNKRKKHHAGRWTSYNSRSVSSQNDHSHHNSTVGDASHLAKEKEGGFDDPNEVMEMRSVESGSSYKHPPPHHDVILDVLGHTQTEDGSVSYSPQKMKVNGHSRANGYHTHQQQENGIVTERNVGIGCRDREGRGIGIGHRTSNLDPDSEFPTCPPPDYNDLFQSNVATPTNHVTSRHSNPKPPTNHVTSHHSNPKEWV